MNAPKPKSFIRYGRGLDGMCMAPFPNRQAGVGSKGKLMGKDLKFYFPCVEHALTETPGEEHTSHHKK